MLTKSPIRHFIVAILVALCHLSPLSAEGIYHMGSANNQYLDSKTLLFVHVDQAHKYINLHLCRRQLSHKKIKIKIFTTNVTNGIYSANQTPLVEIEGKDNISCHDNMQRHLSTSHNKFKYKVPAAGVYAIDLSENTYRDFNGYTRHVDFLRWDVAVANSKKSQVDPTAEDGNLFSNQWSFNTTSYSRQASATTRMYVLAPGGFVDTNYVWILDLHEFSGFVYDVLANDVGLNPPYSGLSVSENADDPSPSIEAKYPVYLNYPHGAKPKPSPNQAPSLLEDLIFLDDQAIDNSISPNDDGIQDSGEFTFIADVSGTYAITIDLNKDGEYGANDRLLLGNTQANTLTRVSWDGKDASGNLVANNSYDVQLELRVGEYHFVARDVETSGGGTNNDGTGDKDGLTILQALDSDTIIGTRVYWDDKTLLSGSSNLPDGVMSSVNIVGEHRHTWGSFSGNGFGNRTFIDTYVYGRSSRSTYLSAVLVEPENNKPVIEAQHFSINERSPLDTLVGQIVASDPDNDELTYELLGGNGRNLFSVSDKGKIFVSGLLKYKPKKRNRYWLKVSVSDGKFSSKATMSIDVLNINDLPVAQDDEATILQNSSNNIINVLSNDSDPDNDTLTITEVNAPSGNVSINNNGTLIYTPEPNAFGEIELTYTISDGNGGLDSASVNVVITAASNSPPIISGTPTTDILESDNYSFTPIANDSDGDPLTFSIENMPDWMSFDPTTGALTGMPIGNDVGTYENIIICVSDGEEETCLPAFSITVRGDEDNDGTPDDRDDDFGPLLTAPDDITVDATGLFTSINIGTATAQDYINGVLTDCCQPVASVENGSLPWFAPGITQVTWSATDEDGNVIEVIQTINVRPLVSFGPDISVAEGSTAVIPVYLNGLSPEYPLEVDFTVVGGTASSDDHNLQSGTITFTESTQATISFDVIEDGLGDDGETILLELNDSVNRGEKSTLVITIVDGNLAPLVELVAVQNNQETFVIEQGSGNAVVTANVFDPNPQDDHSYDWSLSDNVLVDLDAQDETFTFDPSELPLGFYQLVVTVTDDGNPNLDGEATASIRVVISADNIPDISLDPCNIIPQIRGIEYQYMIEAEAGNCLRVGPTGLTSENGAAWLTVTDFENNDSLEAYTVGGSQIVGGRFDVQVYRMDQPGGVVQFVIPLRASIPFDSSVLLYDLNNQAWFEFNIDDNNQVSTALGQAGYCPPPGHTDYQPGLINGDYCLQISIQDGGPNDLDGQANGLIETISGAHVLNDLPEAEDDRITVDQGSENNIINVLSNDSDTNGDQLSVMQAEVDEQLGTVSTNSDNTLSFTPEPNFNGDLVITYTISDGNSGTDNANIRVRVLPKVDLETTGGGSLGLWLILLSALVLLVRRLRLAA